MEKLDQICAAYQAVLIANWKSKRQREHKRAVARCIWNDWLKALLKAMR